MKLYLKEIYNILECKQAFEDTLVERISTDSRTLEKDDVFVAIHGEFYDGANFIAMALKKGASLVITESSIKGKKIINVKDSVIALGDIAKYYKNKFDIPYICVTGSVGKTTTKDFIKAVLSEKYNVHSTLKNFNNHIGLPRTLFELNENHEISITEIGMSGFNEIDYLSKMVEPNVGIISNIGTSHIGNLGSQEGIYKAKSEMLKNMKDGSTLIINGDDVFLKRLKNNKKFKIVTCGFTDENDIYPTSIKEYSEGLYSFTVDECEFKLNIQGKHNILNSLFAVAIGKMYDVDISTISKGISKILPSKMRVETKKNGDYIIINDAYNAITQSMKAGIDILKSYKQRKVAILGDMLELGEYAKNEHEAVGEYLHNQNIDILICCGKDAIFYKEGAIKAGKLINEIYYYKDIDELSLKINDILMKNDVILLKGSRGVAMEKILKII